jgi:hypothetical protein
VKPFRLSANWVAYAHGPAADDRQPSAVELCDLITERDYVLVPGERLDLIREIIDVAGLYSSAYGGDREDRLRAARAGQLIKRACKWIEDTSKAKGLQ